MVEETLVPGAVVSEVARRHGLMPQQLFTWRRLARQLVASDPVAGPPMFVPAVIEGTSLPSERRPRRNRRGRKAAKTVTSPGMIEMEIDGVAIRVGHGADARMVVAVIRALKAGP
jgi:transposase